MIRRLIKIESSASALYLNEALLETKGWWWREKLKLNEIVLKDGTGSSVESGAR